MMTSEGNTFEMENRNNLETECSANAKFTIPTIGDSAEADNAGVDEIHGSLCVQCQGTGTTRMLVTKIPFFREVIISSFECDDCGWSNNQVLFGGEIQEQGCHFDLKVCSSEDLNRQVIKSDYATVLFPEIEFEIPCKTQQGEITTIEGLLSTAATRLGYDQKHRLETNAELGCAIADIILKLHSMSSGESLPFTVTIDDPSGNSFVENPSAPARDPNLTLYRYARTPEQDLLLGLRPAEPEPVLAEGSTKSMGWQGQEGTGPENFLKQESASFADLCPSCHKLGETLMCMADIPHFKEVIIMAFSCTECGYKSNEVKGGGAVPLLGTLHTLKAENPKDFSRDILKSDSCAIFVPELGLEMELGTLGSMYTTLEGLLEKVRANLCFGNPFYSGDSATHHHGSQGATQMKFREFLDKLDALRGGQLFPFTLILKDPLGNSFIGALGYDRPEDDPQIQVDEYERSHDELEILGLNDIQTEGFELVPDGLEGDKPVQSHIKPMQHRVGSDHPIPFAKGTEDETLSSADIPKH